MGCNCGGSQQVVRQPLGSRKVQPQPQPQPAPGQIGPLSADHYASPGDYVWSGPPTNENAK